MFIYEMEDSVLDKFVDFVTKKDRSRKVKRIVLYVCDSIKRMLLCSKNNDVIDLESYTNMFLVPLVESFGMDGTKDGQELIETRIHMLEKAIRKDMVSEASVKKILTTKLLELTYSMHGIKITKMSMSKKVAYRCYITHKEEKGRHYGWKCLTADDLLFPIGFVRC